MVAQFLLFTSGTAASKKATSGIMAALAVFGVVENDIPLFVAVFIGLLGGTAAAWARERQTEREFPKHWLLMQVAAYILIFVFVTALHEYPGLTTRWSAAIAGLLSFAGREGLQAAHRRTVREIESRDI